MTALVLLVVLAVPGPLRAQTPSPSPTSSPGSGLSPEQEIERLQRLVEEALLNRERFRSQIQNTERGLAHARTQLDEVILRIGRETEVYGRLQADANRLAAAINEIETRIALAEARIAGLQQRVRDAAFDIEATQARLDARARSAYKNGPAGDVEFVLGATSLADLATRMKMVDRVAASDEELIQEIEKARALLERDHASAEDLERTLIDGRAELGLRQGQLDGKMAEQTAALARLEHSKGEAQAMIAGLNDELSQQREAARLVETLRRSSQRAAAYWAEVLRQQALAEAAANPGPIEGVLQVCPVDEPRSYINDWGFPRYTGGYHPHQGNDIFAPAGTPVRAPFPGEARDATNTIGGLSVEVRGAAGYVYNAHLSGFAKLGLVQAGDVIGYVGDSGNARGGSPHNHFEWHPGYGPAVNPFPYLNAVCVG